MLYVPYSCSSFQFDGLSALFVRLSVVIRPRTKVKYLLNFVESDRVALEDQTWSGFTPHLPRSSLKFYHVRHFSAKR